MGKKDRGPEQEHDGRKGKADGEPEKSNDVAHDEKDHQIS